MSIWDDLGTALGLGLDSATSWAIGRGANPRPRWRSSGTLTPTKPIQERMQAGYGGVGSSTGLPRPGSIEAILEELQRLQDPNRYGVDQALLERQAMSAAAAQYDPMIAALRGQMSAAQTRASRNQGQLQGMYSGLSNQLMQEVAPIQQRYATTQANVAKQYQGLQNQIQQQYTSSQAQQEEMMRRLNIEAAAPEALQGQVSDRDAAVTAAAQESQNVASQLAQQEGGAVNYTQQGSQMARTEGTNRVADLMAALEQYLGEASGQVAGYEAARSSAAQGNLASLMQESQKSAVDRAQRDFENYIRVLGVAKELQAPQQGLGPTKSPVDVGSRAMGLGVDAGGAQQIQNAFMTAISDPLVMSAVDPTSGMSLSKEALANRVVEVGRSKGLNSAQLNALQNIALEYFGRR